MVEFEWDEDKRRSNSEKHGVDFRDARDVSDMAGHWYQGQSAR